MQVELHNGQIILYFIFIAKLSVKYLVYLYNQQWTGWALEGCFRLGSPCILTACSAVARTS